VAAVAACVAAAAAVAMALFVAAHVRQETQRRLFTTGLDTLWRYEAQWNSDAMFEARSAAAAALLDGRPTRAIDEVLDFFDQLGLLLNRGALDEEMVGYQFYWPLANYWLASQDYVGQVRRSAPHLWEHLETVMGRLLAVEARRRHLTTADAVPTTTQMREFLSTEAAAGECAPEQEAEMRQTPL